VHRRIISLPSCTGDRAKNTLFPLHQGQLKSAMTKTGSTTINIHDRRELHLEEIDEPQISRIETYSTVTSSSCSPNTKAKTSSHHQPTLTPTLRLRTNTMLLEPPHRMIRMIAMPTTRAEAQERPHNLLNHHLRCNDLLLPNAPAGIRCSKPESTNRAPRHMSTAFRAHSSCVRRWAFDLN
jgi:hypothetical protein